MTREPSLQSDVILRVADMVGELMEFWGFKRNMGRMWTLLYLAPKPLSAAELASHLSLSSGAVSMLLSGLADWGAVKKAWVPGERRDYYEPETSIWKLISRVLRERELRKVSEAIDVFEHAAGVLRQRLDAADARARADLEPPLGRVESLLALARAGHRLLDAVLSGQSVSTSPLEILSGQADAADEPE